MEPSKAPTQCHGCGGPLDIYLTLPNTPLQIERLLDQSGDDNGQSHSLQVGKCQDCGLLQQISRPLDAHYYDDYEQSASLSAAMSQYQKELAEELIISQSLKGKTVLEIGAGDGYFAQILMDAGVNVIALEPGAPSVAAIRARNIPVIHGMFSQEIVAEYGPFDAVFSRQVVSHVEPLGDFLNELRKCVKPGGLVTFECPNIFDSIAQGRFVDFLPDYRSYLSPNSMSALMSKNGFDLQEVTPRWSDEYFLATYVKENTELPEMQNVLAKLRDTLQGMVSKGLRVAIWGAGGRGISLTAQLRLGPQDVAYVIDTSPLKQGKFTPTSGIPIRAPQALRDDPVDVILLTPVNYAPEIIDTLKNEYAFKGEIILPFPEVTQLTL